MRISASVPGRPAAFDRRGGCASEPSVAGHTMLPAVIEAQPAREKFSTARRTPSSAPFVAQLVAAAEDMPAARARRRADPVTGTAAYRSVAGLNAAPRPAAVAVV